MRTMYDSVTASAIPRTAEMVAGYLPPSRYAWSPGDWALFPRAAKVRIAIFASVNDGHVLDVEPGDATPSQAPDWVQMRRRAGLAHPTVYCNLSTWDQVRSEFQRQGVREPHYWIARYDGVAAMIPGAVAKQYANPPVHGRGHFDLSVVADFWPGVDGDKETDMHVDSIDADVLDDIASRIFNRRLNAQFGEVDHTARVAWQETRALARQSTVLLRALDTGLDEHETRVLAAIGALAEGSVDGVDVAELADALAGRLDASLVRKLADELDRRARDGDPSTGPTT